MYNEKNIKRVSFEDKINVCHKEFIRNKERNLSLEDKLSIGPVSRNFRDKFPHNTVYTLVYRDNKTRYVRTFYNFKRMFKVLRSFSRKIKFTEKELIYLEKGNIIRKNIERFCSSVIITKNLIE